MAQELQIAKEIWYEISNFISPVDRSEAAELLVSILIDHDQLPDAIHTAFKLDDAVTDAVTHYLTEEPAFDEEQDQDDEFDDEFDDEY